MLVIFSIIIFGIICFLSYKKLQEYQTLKTEILNLSNKSKVLEDDYTKLKELNINVTNEIEQKNSYIKQLNENVTNAEEMAIRCQKSYAEILEENYNNLETDYDNYEKQLLSAYDTLQDDLRAQVGKLEQDLDKLRTSRAAAIEAQLREKEIEDNISFYSLPIGDRDLEDIIYLNTIKHHLAHPEILSKLIWSTYFQKETTLLCNRINAINTCGIYKITQIGNPDNCYIGQSVNIGDRFKDHIRAGLGIDNSGTNKLYKTMQDKGVWNFTFEILETCSRDLLNEKEKFYINLYMSDTIGMNVQRGNG